MSLLLSRNVCNVIYFRLMGWKLKGTFPDVPKCVIIVAPHTSWWDFIYAMAYYRYASLDINYFGKDSLEKFPVFRTILYKTGYIPVDRTTSHNFVDMVVQKFNERDRLVFSIAPEGTRKYVERWKTGFYHIALEAKVPVIMAFADYKKKEIAIDKVVHLSGDKEKDFQVFREYYKDKAPANEELWNPDFK